MGEDIKTTTAKTTTGSKLPNSATDVTNDNTKSSKTTPDDGKGIPEKMKAQSSSQSTNHTDRDKQAEVGVVDRSAVQEDRSVDDFLFFCFQPLSW